MDDQDQEIVDGEVEEIEENNQNQVTILQSLESLIKENLSKVGKLQEEANQSKEMIDSVLSNDEVYKQHEEAAKQAQKVKTATKSEILKRPDVKHIAEKLKNIKLEIKEIKESMSSYLTEYQRLSGSNQIEDQTGNVMEIVYVAKLVKRQR